ncbi:hypothetical protein Bbelb_067680 [Branchiostoma belcheri]|nr:hypothetical protein Bbelb_067680 [Branchiostoma belcheri]
MYRVLEPWNFGSLGAILQGYHRLRILSLTTMDYPGLEPGQGLGGRCTLKRREGNGVQSFSLPRRSVPGNGRTSGNIARVTTWTTCVCGAECFRSAFENEKQPRTFLRQGYFADSLFKTPEYNRPPGVTLKEMARRVADLPHQE